MAKPKSQDLEYEKRAEKMGWKELRKLWGAVLSGNTPGGKAARRSNTLSSALSA